MEGLTALIGLDFNLHEILAIVFYCQRFSKFKREHSGFFVWVALAFFPSSYSLTYSNFCFIISMQAHSIGLFFKRSCLRNERVDNVRLVNLCFNVNLVLCFLCTLFAYFFYTLLAR